jgi:hypothetical protein
MSTRSIVAALVAVLVAALTLTAVAFGEGRPLVTTLAGASEVPGPGDPDGSGTASLTLNPGQEEVCFELSVSNIALPATGAHIHVIDPALGFGPVVVPLTPPDSSGTSSGCVSADAALIKAIIKNPERYYVNVHTFDYPAGAVRGDLQK